MKVITVVIPLVIALASASADILVVHPKDIPQSMENIKGRITNGYPANEGQAPYTVGLSFRKGNSGWWGGGSIIGNTWILTAGHCTGDADSVTIYFGATSRTSAQFTHIVGNGNFIRHPQYSGVTNDVALIRIPHVDFYHMVNKVELPSFNDRYNNYDGQWSLACGWGGTYDGSPLPDWLQCADLQIINNSECEGHYGSAVVLDSTLCVRTPEGRSTCGGDSGGPLVTHADKKLVGVTSFVSSAGCQSGSPAGFARVTSHLDWIRDQTGIAY